MKKTNYIFWLWASFQAVGLLPIWILKWRIDAMRYGHLVNALTHQFFKWCINSFRWQELKIHCVGGWIIMLIFLFIPEFAFKKILISIAKFLSVRIEKHPWSGGQKLKRSLMFAFILTQFECTQNLLRKITQHYILSLEVYHCSLLRFKQIDNVSTSSRMKVSRRKKILSDPLTLTLCIKVL